MARPLRLEFSGALYHITARGDRREDIYADDEDRHTFLSVLGRIVVDFHWVCHAFCLMGNHYHLVVETPDANLSKGMRQLNGVYTQAFNRRHGLVGHLFQGRYKAILVDEEAYLLALSRYVVLNPVRARIVRVPEAWPWSSHRMMLGMEPSPGWLQTNALLARFGSRRSVARQRYAQFVAEGAGQDSIWKNLRRQIYLGDEHFAERMQAKLGRAARDDIQIPIAQRRRAAPALAAIEAAHEFRDDAVATAHATGEYSYQQIAEHFGIHFTTVGRIVRAHKQARERVRSRRMDARGAT